MAPPNAASELLRRHDQEHLLAFYDELPPDRQANLLAQVDQIDFDRGDRLIRSHVLTAPEFKLPEDLAPARIAPPEPRPDDTAGADRPFPPTEAAYEAGRRRGEELISAGKVAALVVAGGDGTRLGYEGPKGCLPITPVKRKPLFQVFAEQILATRRRYGAPVPWYVMTSVTNDEATREFFAANDNWGLPAEDVFFFRQGRMPAIGLDGKILLAEKDQIAWNPDGHGGCLPALRASGALEDMAGRGVEQISYFQVDNPLVRCVDPLFIGLHAERGAEMSAKALPKRSPHERVGNFCRSDGKTIVIEYSDLPDELAEQCGPDGRLRFSAGSIAIHVFSRSFVERLTHQAELPLPFHRAVKKVSCIIPTGQAVTPSEPNAVKLERFIFDAMPLAQETLVLETVRSEEFSPVKNATGSDSPTTCLHDQVARAAGWLEAAGVTIPCDADGNVAAAIEISPLFALDERELVGKVAADLEIKPGDSVCLE
jgi:UDP-N-acetylglucosamine/UDP-N-acetylgalactosamine diphosphorylase